MKTIEAIIRPVKLDEVLTAIEKTECSDIVVYEVKGHEGQKSTGRQQRGGPYQVTLMTKIEITTNDENVEQIKTAVASSAKTGKSGDGKIFVYDISRTHEIHAGGAEDQTT
jgi:nitrogen regulatory protein PII